MQQHSIALVHTQALLRGSLAHMLADTGTYRVLADVADPPALKRAFAIGKLPDLVLLCWENATADSCATLHWLSARHPSCRLLVLGNNAPLPQLLHTLRSGAHGYCHTSEGPVALCRVLNLLLQGALYYPPDLWTLLRNSVPAPKAVTCTLPKPSAMQRAFLIKVAADDNPTYPQIAERMKKSPRAIDHCVEDLFKKYGIKGKTGFVKLAQDLGLV